MLPTFNAEGTPIPIVFEKRPGRHTEMSIVEWVTGGRCLRCVIAEREGALKVHVLRRG
jgi:hypothetical protein